MSEMLESLRVYCGKPVLITGHTGFKGGWLAAWLTKLGAQVIGYSLAPPTKPSLFEAAGLERQITHITGDVRVLEHLLEVFDRYRPQFVFHLAAQAIVKRSYQEPRLTYETNVMGTVNVLEAVRITGSGTVIVIATSDKCYENREWVYGYRETDPLGGHDPYSSSKGCAELVAEAYRRSFFTAGGIEGNACLATARAGNVIGGGDWAESRLVPDCVKALAAGEEIAIRNPAAVRPWQYILEPLGGYLLLGARLRHEGASCGGAWNFGPPDDRMISVEAMVQKLITCWGRGSYRIEAPPGAPHEARLLKLDCSKSTALLGWKPVYPLDAALSRTLEWYRRFYGDYSVSRLYDCTVKEIEEYESARRGMDGCNE